MPAATEQRHPSVQKDGGEERGIREDAQAFDAALKASWTETEREEENI